MQINSVSHVFTPKSWLVFWHYLKLKYVVKKCWDRNIFLFLFFFWHALEPFQTADFGLYSGAKFFSVYPGHCLCSCSDFSLKNIYNSYSINSILLMLLLILRVIIFSDLFPYILEHLTFALYVTVCVLAWFVLPFIADLISAVAFYLSQNSFVISTGFFFISAYNSAQSYFCCSPSSHRDDVCHLLCRVSFSKILFSSLWKFIFRDVFHQALRHCCFFLVL